MHRSVRVRGKIIEYELQRTDRRSIECRVTAEGVKVFAPRRAPLDAIEEMIKSRAGWIEENQHALRERQRSLQSAWDMKNGMSVPMEGQIYRLKVIPGGKKGVSLMGDELILSGTDGSYAQAEAALRAFLIGRMKERLQKILPSLSAQVGVEIGRVTIREQRTRWGSCSGKGNLNFNWKLIMAPPEALRYVVIHELCHRREMNHSPDFWALLEKHMPDYAIWRKFLADGWPHPFP